MGPLVLALIQHVPTAGELLAEAVLLVVLIAGSAFLSGSEIALLSFSKVRRMQLADDEHPGIVAVEKLLVDRERLLITVLVADTLLNVAATVSVAVFAARVFDSFVVAIAIAGAAFLLLTFGEVLPKAFAASHAEKWALAVAPTIVALQRVLFPIARSYQGLNHWLFRSMGERGQRGQKLLQSEEEIKTLIALGAEEGVLAEKEEDMLHSVIEFASTTAREIMVPRIDMVAVPADAQLDHIKAFLLDSGYSRTPVYQGTLDNVVGVLNVKDVLIHYLEKKGGSVTVRELMREAFFVPESKKLDDLLQDMREKRVHVAIVIDEFGGTAGMLTLEDVIEEIVGDIFDEYDLRTDPVRKIDAMTSVVDARIHVADVNRALDLEIPEGEGYDTVAGYIYSELGRLAKEGEVVHGPGFDLVVEKVTNRRVLRARLVKHTRPPEQGEETVVDTP
ncbi:MAG TPA: hemolysin family protein [Candidatus Thermoplasmatota archaeon]|nr:hemolysin family protein [Candidatus Thermoplasmatota archaeon]